MSNYNKIVTALNENIPSYPTLESPPNTTPTTGTDNSVSQLPLISDEDIKDAPSHIFNVSAVLVDNPRIVIKNQ